MPKAPPVEYILLKVPCPLERLGNAIAALSKLDLHGFETEVVTVVPAFAKRANHEVSSEDVLLEWIKTHPTFKAIEAVRHFEQNGRTKGSTYPALGVLVEKGVLKKLDPGNYARTDVKHLAGPKKSEKKEKPATANRYEVSHVDFILRYARRNHGRFAVAKVKDAFEKDKRYRDSVSTAINTLIERKQAKRVALGEYVLLNDAAKKKAVAKKEAPQQPNNETAEVTNG
jgi:hypothetical protein